jgi:TolB-like protein
MLAGELPFDAPDTRGILMQHLTQPLPSLRARRPSVRAELAVVVERCAAKVREDRFASASELAEALRTALSAKPAPPARVERRPRWIIGGVLLLVVAAAATLGLLYRSRLGAPPQQQSDIANAESVRTTAPVIAVLPFEVSGNSDTAQGRTTARLLTNALTIDFDVQTVDVNRFLSLWTSEKRSIGALLDSNAAFAWLQGANQVVYGSSVQVGDQLRLTVDVYDTRDLVRLGQVKQTGDADSLLTLVDSLAGAVARAFCQRPEFNPGNLCFDSAPLPSAPIVVPYMGQPPSAPAKVFVRVTADGAYGDALPSSAPMEILAEALPVLRTARYVPARKAGRPVAAWAEVELTVRPPDLSVSPRSAVESLSIGVDQAALITLGSRPLAAMTINGRPVRGNPVANYRVRAGRIRVQFRVTDSSGVWVADTVLTAGPGQTRNFGRIPLRRP